MDQPRTKQPLTPALEDYLETIYELVRDQKFARVKDIARLRGVRSGSVSPAMNRLAEMGLIKYVRREYIDLTAKGEREGRRIFARHQLLTRFFEEILRMSPQNARRDACEMEHSLSAEGMDHLARFFEFLQVCPRGSKFLSRFAECSLVHDDVDPCADPCEALSANRPRSQQAISSLAPGDRARISQVNVDGDLRQRLLDMGILPGVSFEVARVTDRAITIELQGFQLALSVDEARVVMVEPRKEK